MEIMKLIPTGKDYLWGGTRLREEYGKKIDLTAISRNLGVFGSSGRPKLCGKWYI